MLGVRRNSRTRSRSSSKAARIRSMTGCSASGTACFWVMASLCLLDIPTGRADLEGEDARVCVDEPPVDRGQHVRVVEEDGRDLLLEDHLELVVERLPPGRVPLGPRLLDEPVHLRV